MMTKTLTASAAAFLTSLVLVACGGGGAQVAGIEGTGAPPNTPANAFSLGTVTAFGSVFVNGVRFDTSNATFTIDGASGTEGDLGVGDVVLVTGTLNAGSTTDGAASSVVYDDAVEGPIESIDTATSTLVVLGQTAQVSAEASFDDSIQPASLDGLNVSDIVEISGFVASDGTIQATRIESKPTSTEFEATGVVSMLDAANFRFMINALEVDYANAMLNNFPTGAVTDGDLVEAKGSTTLGPNGELVATSVELKSNGINGSAGDQLEVEGFITRFVDATDFDVSGLPVTTTNQTTYTGGASNTAADLGLDIKVEAEGTLDANGVLVATKIDIRRARAVRASANVDSVDASNNSFVTLGITVKVDALTRIEDKSSQDVEPFSVGDLVVDDFVEVRGTEFPAGSGEILAGRVEREDPDATELQGFVTAESDPSFTILGVTIMTDGSTTFRAIDGSIIQAADFFNQVVVAGGGNSGSLVKATGTESGPQTIDASQVEFEFEQ